MPHRPEQFFTPTKLYYDSPHRVEPGEFIISNGGAVYLVRRVRHSPTKRFRKYLDVLRFDPRQVPPGAVVHDIRWYPRRRKSLTGTRRRAIVPGVAEHLPKSTGGRPP